MPMEITHQFISEVADDGDSTLVRPSDWNAIHLFDGDFGPLATAYAELASDQGSVSSDTATDVTGCSITLAAGTWLIWGQLSCGPGGSYSYAWLATGSSGTGTPFAQAEDNSGNAAGRITVQIQPVIITPSTSTSYHLRGQLGGGGTFYSNPNSQGKASFITALRIDQGAIASGGTAVLAQRTSSQSISSNPTAIAFNATDIYDPDGWHDPSSNNTQLICPTGKGGRVFIATGSAEVDGGSTYIRITKNGSSIMGQTAVAGFTHMIAVPVYLDDGDYLEMLITNTTSQNLIQTDVPTTFGIIATGSGATDYVGGKSGSGHLIIPGLSSDPDIRPATAGSGDDEFDTTDTSDPMTGLTTMGSPTTHDINSTFLSHYYVKKNATGTLGAHGVYKAKSTPFTLVVKLSDAAVLHADQEVGIFVGEATPGKFSAVFVSHVTGSPGTLVTPHQLWTNPTTFGSTVVTYARSYLPACYFKIIATSSTDVSYYISSNGRIWTPISLNHNPSFTVGSAGLVIVQDSATYAIEAAFDFMRFS